MKEVWKDIENFEGLYQISNLGRCRSLDRIIQRVKGKSFYKGKIIKPTICSNGYLSYILQKSGKRKSYLAHRLVAIHFIDNTYNKKEVNHKDENIQNNEVNNLEWVTPKENSNYGTRNLKCRECNRDNFKRVHQYTKDNQYIRSFECIEDAAKFIGIKAENISRAARGVNNRKYAKGYIWRLD